MYTKWMMQNRMRMFGEDDGGGEGGNGGEQKTFDDFLKENPEYQKEFDRRMTKGLETAKTKWDAETATKIEDAKTEAEKLAKMNAQEKAEHERQKREEELNAREAALTARELKATATQALAEKKLPLELVGMCDLTSAEKCNESISTIEKVFRESVQKSVEERLKGGDPKVGGNGGDDPHIAAMRRAMGLPAKG